MKLKLFISTCPNDTFMFDAIINKRIDTSGFEFETYFTDIEELNSLALKGESDITKISINAFSRVINSYDLLTSGAALGCGVGPLVISKRKLYPDEFPFAKFGIPGINTTANLLFSLAYPNAQNKKVYLFSDIEDAILANEIDAGVIIHESRFTYQNKGLKMIVDLGDYWEKKTHLPIPLGGIAIRKDLTAPIKTKINSLVKRSIEYAFENPKESKDFVKKYARETDDEVIKKHIELYVNKHSLNMGEEGKNSIIELLKRSSDIGLTTVVSTDLFVE